MSAKVETLNINKSSLRFNIFSVILIAAGVLLITWIILSNHFRDGENFLTAKSCLPFAASLGLIFTGGFIGTKWKHFAFWSSLGLVGFAASLQMIDAGRLIHFQHYRSFSELLNRDAWAPGLFI